MDFLIILGDVRQGGSRKRAYHYGILRLPAGRQGIRNKICRTSPEASGRR